MERLPLQIGGQNRLRAIRSEHRVLERDRLGVGEPHPAHEDDERPALEPEAVPLALRRRALDTFDEA